jgi:hypothetical protein
MVVSNCYVCLKPGMQLSPRGRCVKCEYERSIANEKEVEELQTQIAEYEGG